MNNIAIIGGGAAGLSAAINASINGANVTIYEKSDRVGKKILVTGNGRCNLSNLNVNPKSYNCPDFVKNVLAEYNCEKIRAFFQSMGLWTYSDDEGRIYPLSDTASSVLDVMRLKCTELGVKEKCLSDVISIKKSKMGYELKCSTGENIYADKVIVTVGGKNKLLATIGHKYAKFRPVLVPIKTDISLIKGLSGIRVHCKVSLSKNNINVAEECGELLFRDYGVSGVVIFDISRFAEAGQTLKIDLLPDIDEEKLKLMLIQRKNDLKNRPFEEFLTGIFHKRISQVIMRKANSQNTDIIAHTIKNLELNVLGVGDEKQAQVTAGGANTSEFDDKTMQSKISEGLFAAGEVLDVDGKCGGYNLHWAFSSGLTAGYFACNGR